MIPIMKVRKRVCIRKAKFDRADFTLTRFKGITDFGEVSFLNSNTDKANFLDESDALKEYIDNKYKGS